MTFVELLRLLVARCPGLPEPLIADATKLLDELERTNAFGIVLGKTAVQEHTCFSVNQFSLVCDVCHKEYREGPKPKGTYW